MQVVCGLLSIRRSRGGAPSTLVPGILPLEVWLHCMLMLLFLMPYDRCLSNSRMVSVSSPCSCSSFLVHCFEIGRNTSHHRMLRASTVIPKEDISSNILLQSPCCSLSYSSSVAMSYFPPPSFIEIQVQDGQMSISFLGHCNTFTVLLYFSPSGRAPRLLYYRGSVDSRIAPNDAAQRLKGGRIPGRCFVVPERRATIIKLTEEAWAEKGQGVGKPLEANRAGSRSYVDGMAT